LFNLCHYLERPKDFFEKALFKGDVEDHLEELKKQTGAEVTVIR